MWATSWSDRQPCRAGRLRQHAAPPDRRQHPQAVAHVDPGVAALHQQGHPCPAPGPPPAAPSPRPEVGGPPPRWGSTSTASRVPARAWPVTPGQPWALLGRRGPAPAGVEARRLVVGAPCRLAEGRCTEPTCTSRPRPGPGRRPAPAGCLHVHLEQPPLAAPADAHQARPGGNTTPAPSKGPAPGAAWSVMSPGQPAHPQPLQATLSSRASTSARRSSLVQQQARQDVAQVPGGPGHHCQPVARRRVPPRQGPSTQPGKAPA